MLSPSPFRARSGGAALALALLVTSSSGALAADDPVDHDAELAKGVPVRFVMGFKAGGGGTLWTEPDDTVLSTVPSSGGGSEQFGLPIFDETRGGYTMSAGIFAEGIFYENFGLEVGAHFVQHTLLENIKWSFVESVTQNGQTSVTTFNAKSDEELSFTALHVPILVKAIVPSGKTRISLGVGPEFAFASWSKTKFKITEGGETDQPCQGTTDGKLRLPGSRCAFQTLKSKLEDSVYLSVVFGIEITAGDFLIPIDIHWSYNFSQPAKYRERGIVLEDEIPNAANPDAHPTELTLKTRDSMYGGIRIGIAYQFN
ncbi:MAG: hypothetical protein KC635_08960 [Myxococcales bacterium]|nr:hypothetical protein [Myxococcales bacterium]MCB9736724.1 hypothetical protein [Deltaproteobacteria bacterium]